MALSRADENLLAKAMQHSFPLCPQPFAALGDVVGANETEVLDCVRTWREEGRLREISAILEGSALGYESALVAGEVPAERLDEVAEIINEHPTITHNYVRNHRYNLWFTLAVPEDMGLEPTLERLSVATRIPRFHALRRTDTFKIGVNFDLESRRSHTEKVELVAAESVATTEATRRIFRALQVPLELERFPFERIARLAGVDESALLAFAHSHRGGAMRRYVATFHHRKLGVRGNGMGVWNVPAKDHHRVGDILASAPEVSHCYARNAIVGFPYTVYSMIHGPDEDAVRDIVHRLSRETGVDDYLILFSSRELKKCRLRYFLPELEAWWTSHPAQEAA